MRSSCKRIGFLPRKEVGKIIDQIAFEENLSKSKIVGLLVEEALSARGIFDPRIAKNLKSSTQTGYPESLKTESYNQKGKEELISDSGLSTQSSRIGSATHSSSAEIKEEDLAILAKIKSLKALGLL